MALFERFRSRERDAQTDNERAAALRATIETAIQSARREFEGLTRRVEEARRRAAFIDTDYRDETGGIEPADERLLDEMEASLLTGERRLVALERQIAGLEGLLGAVDRVFVGGDLD